MFWKKHKTLKAIWAVLGHLKPNKFLCRPTMVTDIFSKILPPPPPPTPTSYFRAATALRPQEAAMTALVRLAVYCFIHLQGIHFDLVVDIIVIVSVYFWVQSHMLHYSLLAYSIINFLDRRFWIFRICIIKCPIRVSWECCQWNNIQGGWINRTFSFQYWYTFLLVKF